MDDNAGVRPAGERLAILGHKPVMIGLFDSRDVAQTD
jgi:hypothetical protein